MTKEKAERKKVKKLLNPCAKTQIFSCSIQVEKAILPFEKFVKSFLPNILYLP